jgi:hypothetical protein
MVAWFFPQLCLPPGCALPFVNRSSPRQGRARRLQAIRRPKRSLKDCTVRLASTKSLLQREKSLFGHPLGRDSSKTARTHKDQLNYDNLAEDLSERILSDWFNITGGQDT